MNMLFKSIAAQHADKVALIEPHYQVTYGDLPQLISYRMGRIKDYRCLALMMNNTIEWVVWDITAFCAGIPLVPIPPFFTKEQRDHAMKSAGCDGVITTEGIIPLSHDPVTLPTGTIKITYTSGTTGTPKGVCLSPGAMENVAHSIVQCLGKDLADKHACVLPLGVLLENVAGVYATLLAGGTVCLNHLESFGENYANLHSILKEAGATSVILVPEILRILMHQVSQHGALPALSHIAVGGSKVAPDLVAQAREMGLPVYEGYGLSECASVVAMNTPDHDKPGTVGKLLPHIRAYVEKDEIIVRNTGFLGYVGETAPSHIRTGDLGTFDEDGFLSITGRSKNVLITSYGRNISPEWVESELLAQPEIAQVVVYGDGAPVLSAFVVPAFKGANINRSLDQVNARLPDYARVKQFTIVPPFSPKDGTLTGTGRPRRSRITQLYQKETMHELL